MAFGWTILYLGCLSLCIAPLACAATESTTTTAPTTTHETPAVDLGALLDAGKGAVVTLVAGDTRLVAHRAVLAARSPHFKAMLSNSTLGASRGQLVISDVEGPVLRQLLVYLYTLQAPQVSSMAPQLLAAADRYGVPGLKAASEHELVAQLAVGNVVLAVRHDSPRLKEAAVAFIRANFLNVVATQAWARALVSHPKDMADVVQLLAESPADTSTPAAADSGSAPGQTHSGSSQTPAASTPAPPACNAPLPDDHTVSRYGNLSAPERGRRLIEAAKQGAVGEVRALLAAGADVGARDEDNKTALHWAAIEGHADVAKCLLDGGAEVDAKDSKKEATPLHFAAAYGRAAVVRLLAAASADVNSRSKSGWTPLIATGNTDTAAALLDFGAEVNASEPNGDTPLHKAAFWGHTAAVRLLASASADLNARNEEGWTPLHVAATRGHKDTVAALLDCGAELDARDNEQKTPLHWAAYWGIKSMVPMVQQLAEASADLNARDETGRTPLHYTASRGLAEATAALLRAGADRGIRDNDGQTPVDVADNWRIEQVFKKS